MRTIRVTGLLGIVLLILLSGVDAQNVVPGPKTSGVICRVEDGRLVFDIDLDQTLAELNDQAARFDLDTAILRQAMMGIPAIVTAEGMWTVQRLSPHRLILSKSLWGNQPQNGSMQDVVMIDDSWVRSLFNTVTRPVARFGINRFNDVKVFSYRDGLATFTLSGAKKAHKVLLSGSFNNWSTMKTPMERTDKGWSISLPLRPGEYEYKYIVDGRWMTDPGNEFKRENDAGSDNSVVYIYNYRFFLPGHLNARRVVLAASFNDWNENGPRMNRVEGGWELKMWVQEGTHAYKFIVDGEWMLDPNARVNRPDGSGNVNSFMSVGDTMNFLLNGYRDAQRVMLAGNFNAWNGGELQMSLSSRGWELPYVLAPGIYEYKFIVDGKWIADPDNPFTNGEGDGINSVLVVDPNYVFRLMGYPDAERVLVSGSFNDWSKSGYRMVKKGEEWVMPVNLAPGKYSYKFVVDGKWILDPANKLWEQNEYNTGNSVLWIEQ